MITEMFDNALTDAELDAVAGGEEDHIDPKPKDIRWLEQVCSDSDYTETPAGILVCDNLTKHTQCTRGDRPWERPWS